MARMAELEGVVELDGVRRTISLMLLPGAPLSTPAAREEFERHFILRRYRECGGNMSRTAEALAEVLEEMETTVRFLPCK